MSIVCLIKTWLKCLFQIKKIVNLNVINMLMMILKLLYMSILIADSGSTKTDWVLLDNNNIIIQFQTIGFNPYFQSSEDIYTEIKNKLIPVLQDQLHAIKHIAYYGAGCSTPKKYKL